MTTDKTLHIEIDEETFDAILCSLKLDARYVGSNDGGFSFRCKNGAVLWYSSDDDSYNLSVEA